jgi:hypothetical protein
MIPLVPTAKSDTTSDATIPSTNAGSIGGMLTGATSASVPFDNPMLRNPLLMLSQWLLQARPHTVGKVYEKGTVFTSLADDDRMWLQSRSYATLQGEDMEQMCLGHQAPPNVFVAWEQQIVSSEYPSYRTLAQSPITRGFSLSVPSEEALAALKHCGPLCELGAGTGYWAALLRSRGADVVAYDLMPPRPAVDKADFLLGSPAGQLSNGKDKRISTDRKKGIAQNSSSKDKLLQANCSRNMHCGEHTFTTVLKGDGIEVAGTDMAAERALLLVWPYNKHPSERVGMTNAEIAGRLEAWDSWALAKYRGKILCLVGELDKRNSARKGHFRTKSASFSASFQTTLYRDYELKHAVRLPPLVLGSFDELTIWMRKTWTP